MLTCKEAQEIVIGLSTSFGTETVSLDKALGRTLAEPIVADRDYPPFNRATMDGYAMHLADVENGIREFTVIETIFAGQTSDNVLASGQCFKIMTGAAVPDTADMIIPREVIIARDDSIEIQPAQYSAFQHISRKGEDVKEGEFVIKPFVSCTPALVSAMAALGKATVKVQQLPRVALFTTGNEIVPVGEPVAPGQIRNSNQYLLSALLKKWGIEPFICEHIRDDKNQLYAMLSKGIMGDIVIVSGGVSAGDADYVPEILECSGVKKLFHKIAIKPGKPVWCGHIPGGAMVFALPGNPFSSLVTFMLLVETYLSHCFGTGDPEQMILPFNGNRGKKSALDEFFPVSVQGFPLSASPLTFNGSGDILAALVADGLAHHPASVATLSPESAVSVRIFKK